MIALGMSLYLDVGAPWFAFALGFLGAGLVIATARKTMSNFSRKRLLEKVRPAERARFDGYFERLDEYEVALRIIDQGARIGLVGCAVLPFVRPFPEAADAEINPLANLAAFLVLLLGAVGVVIVCLELIPAILSRLAPEGLMRRALPLIDCAYGIMRLPMDVYGAIVTAGARAIGGPPPRDPETVIEEEILAAAEDGEREGLIERSEMSMIEGVIRFGDHQAVDVLTPRTEMVAIEVSTPIPECVRIARECGHSRIPVFSGNKDSIVGILYVKDLLRYWERRDDDTLCLEELMREAHFVQESALVTDIFQEFRDRRFHIAIVQDEFGGTTGLLTIEDIIEEILGDIEDEYELEDSYRLERVSEHEFEVDARYAISDFNDELRDQLPTPLPEDLGCDTVGGFLFTAFGRVPPEGETYDYGSLHFEVMAADERMIRQVRVQIQTKGAETAGAG